jgi:hypothetical protein
MSQYVTSNRTGSKPANQYCIPEKYKSVKNVMCMAHLLESDPVPNPRSPSNFEPLVLCTHTHDPHSGRLERFGFFLYVEYFEQCFVF